MLKLFGKRGLRRPRAFNFIPRSYDEERERFAALREQSGAEGAKARIADGFQRHRTRKSARGQGRAAAFRVLLILIILVIITYGLLTMFLPQLQAGLR